jgi:hypothetical protein
MPQPIAFTEQENRHLQEIWIEISQNAQRRQYYEAVYPSIISKLEAWPAPATFSEQESRAIQTVYRAFDEVCRPWPVLDAVQRTFGQDQRQMGVVESILAKVEAAG